VAHLYVLAGVNGAGKSSIGGATIRAFGADYYNPDEAARALRSAEPGMDQVRANSLAWQQGKRLLERAINERLDFAIETTLGGSTMLGLLMRAAALGIEVRVLYVGLPSAEAHIERVRQRVRAGGHDIPEADIRRRYRHSRLNLVRLLPHLTELRVLDNSAEADPAAGHAPQPVLVLHVKEGRIVGPADLSSTPAWAKPIVAAALRLGH
jgi:predicted ABC-type ATPase